MPDPFRISIAATAAKEIRRLPRDTQATVIAALEALALQPRSGKPLVAELAGFWSLRRGDYRVIYRIDDDARSIEVARIAHRRDVYRRR